MKRRNIYLTHFVNLPILLIIRVQTTFSFCCVKLQREKHRKYSIVLIKRYHIYINTKIYGIVSLNVSVLYIYKTVIYLVTIHIHVFPIQIILLFCTNTNRKIFYCVFKTSIVINTEIYIVDLNANFNIQIVHVVSCIFIGPVLYFVHRGRRNIVDQTFLCLLTYKNTFL